MDIIIFAILAAFLVFRLWSVLGSRSGNNDPLDDGFQSRFSDEDRDDNRDEERREQGGDKPQSIFGSKLWGNDQQAEDVFKDENAVKLQDDERKIRAIIPGFELEKFADISEEVFKKIINAYHRNDLPTLKTLLAEKIYFQFESNIADRLEKDPTGGNQEDHVLEAVKADPVGIEIKDNKIINITVHFKSEHTRKTFDNKGNPVSVSYTNNEIWTFEKDPYSSNPTWFLVKTSME